MDNLLLGTYMDSLTSHIIGIIEGRKHQNPVLSRDLEKRAGVTGVKIREIIHRARTEWNMPICAESKGYFMPDNKLEADRTIRSLRSRAKQLIEAADGIEKHYNKDSQMRLL